jgi:hypothetical protein
LRVKVGWKRKRRSWGIRLKLLNRLLLVIYLICKIPIMMISCILFRFIIIWLKILMLISLNCKIVINSLLVTLKLKLRWLVWIKILLNHKYNKLCKRIVKVYWLKSLKWLKHLYNFKHLFCSRLIIKILVLNFKIWLLVFNYLLNSLIYFRYNF